MIFQHRKQWVVHYMEADCRTPVHAGRYYHYSSLDELLQILTNANAPPDTFEEFARNICQCSRGSVWLNLTDEQYAKLKG